jgi:hypothetical protein
MARKRVTEPIKNDEPKIGKPPMVKFDYNELEKLAYMSASAKEIARFFRCSESTIERRKVDDPKFKDALDYGYARGNLNLRRQQMKAADEGNITMLIWLGKNRLGQTDKIDTRLSGTGEHGEIQVAGGTELTPSERISAGIARILERKRAGESS